MPPPAGGSPGGRRQHHLIKQGARHASPSSVGAPRRPQFPRPASRFVCSGHERARRHERPRATQWVAPALGHNVGARHCLALIRRRPAPPTISQARLAICLFRARTSASARTTEGDPVGRPYVGTQCRGEALPRPHPATLRRPQFPRPASRFVCSGHERGRRHERPRATQWVAPTLGHNVGARHASPSSGDAPRRPQFPRHASRFVCSGHERARRHERPRARHCLALIRRRPAPPTISQARLAICLFRARGRPSGSPLRWDTM